MYAGVDEEFIRNFGSDSSVYEGGNVIAAYPKGKFKTVDFGGEKRGRKEAIDLAISEGYDGVILKNHYDAGGVQDQYVVFDPANIRSVNAAFDPAKTDSPNLLAGGAAAAVGLGAATQGEDASAMQIDPEAEAEIDRRITARVRGGQYARRRQQRQQRYQGLRDSLLSGVEQVTANITNALQPAEIFNSLEMPQRGLLGLGMGAAQLAQGETPQTALMEAARIAEQPVDQTAYEAGAYAQDQGATPVQSALVNVATQMLSPL
jgi:hypothetical protein